MDRRKYKKDYENLNRRLESIWFPKVKKAIKTKTSSLTAKIRRDGVEAGISYLNTDIGNFPLRRVIEQLYTHVGLKHATIAERRLRKEVGKKSTPVMIELKRFGNSAAWVQFIQNYLRQFLLEKITFSVNKTTRDQLLNVLKEAIEKGWGVDQTVNQLNQLPFTAYQAARIVRTEINRAANVGVQAQGETFEYELMKEWISVHDFRTRGRNPEDRADHYSMDEQTVDFYGVFRDPRNGHELNFPGDPKAQAGDTINCRCSSATKPKRDSNGRLIPKKKRAVSVIMPGQIRRPRAVTI